MPRVRDKREYADAYGEVFPDDELDPSERITFVCLRCDEEKDYALLDDAAENYGRKICQRCAEEEWEEKKAEEIEERLRAKAFGWKVDGKKENS